MRQRAAHERHLKHARQADVADVATAATQIAIVLASRQARANALPQRLRSGALRLDLDCHPVVPDQALATRAASRPPLTEPGVPATFALDSRYAATQHFRSV